MVPTQAAEEKADEVGGTLVDPPSTVEDEIPACFGDHNPEELPCSECAVELDCELEDIGVG